MLTSYVSSMLKKVIYYKDEDGVIIAEIPDEEWYYTQGDTFEEARENMIDLIETLLIDKIQSQKTNFFDLVKETTYA